MTNKQRQYELTLRLAAVMSKDYQATFEEAQHIVSDLREELEAYGQNDAFQMAAAGLAQSGLEELLSDVVELYKECVSAQMDFEYQMSAVEAISQAWGGDLEDLTSKALELGENTVFTATQSAEAMTYMAQAGWDAQEMMEGMDAVIDLAAASATDLSEASSIVADTLAGFGMEASDAGELVDVLAQTAANSNTNVSLMGQTFQNAAAIAGALGFSIQDVSVALGLMANAGVKGSRAGTTLRNIFNGLASDVTLTGEAFGDYEFSMFDDQGKTKAFKDTMDELRDVFAQMTDQEKYLNAENIAGLRGYNGLLAILNATDEEYKELYEDIQNADGAAKRMADTRLDNLQGDVTLFKSALEGLEITIGKELNPTLRDSVQIGTGFVQWMNDVAEKNPEVVQGITSITAGLAGFAGIITVAAGIKALASAMSILGLSMSNPVVLGAALVGTLAAIAVNVAQNRSEASRLAKEYEKLTESYEENMSAINGDYKAAAPLIDEYEELANKTSRTHEEKLRLYAITQKLNELMPELGIEYDVYTDKLNTSAEAVKNLARQEWARARMQATMDQIAELYNQQFDIQAEKTRLETEIQEGSKRLEEIEQERKEILDSASFAEKINPFSKTSKKLSELAEERGRLSYNINSGLDERQLAKLDDLVNEEETGELDLQIKALEDQYVKQAALYDNYMSRGQPEEEAVPVAEATTAYITTPEEYGDLSMFGDIADALGMEDFGSGVYEPEEAETINVGDINVTYTVNVEGNADENTVSAISNGLADASADFEARMNQYKRQRTRTLYEE